MPALALFILMVLADPPSAPPSKVVPTPPAAQAMPAPPPAPAAPVAPAMPTPPVTPTGQLSFDQAAALASRDSRALTANQMVSMVSSLSRASKDAMAHCPEPVKPPDFASFTLVMELDASGHVTRTWIDGTTAVATCFEKRMREQVMTRPPHAPYYTAYDMNWQQ